MKNLFKNLNIKARKLFRDYGMVILVCLVLCILIAIALFGEWTAATVSVSWWLFIVSAVVVIIGLSITWILHLLSRSEGYNHGQGLFSSKTLQAGMSWILPLLGILGYTLAYTVPHIEETGDIKEVIIKISDVLVIGGVVGFLSNATHFFGIFKSELESIIYSDRYLGIRKDISEIWDKVSAEMLERRFPDIHKDLFGIIKDHYFCKNEHSYYNDYRILTEVVFDPQDNNFLLVTDYIHFDLVTEKKGPVELTFWASFDDIKGLELNKDFYCRIECRIDREKREPNNTDEKFHDEGNKYTWNHVIIIDNASGKGTYHVSVKRERRYRLLTDHDLSFRAKYIVKDMVVSLRHPPELHASFLCRGTPNDFILVKNDETTKEFIYKGLILQRQGYTFALHKR